DVEIADAGGGPVDGGGVHQLAAVEQLHVLAVEVPGIANQRRSDLVTGDGGGDVPIGIDDDVFDLVAEHRRLVAGGADDDARRVMRLIVVHDGQPELGNVHRDVEVAEVVGSPA